MIHFLKRLTFAPSFMYLSNESRKKLRLSTIHRFTTSIGVMWTTDTGNSRKLNWTTSYERGIG